MNGINIHDLEWKKRIADLKFPRHKLLRKLQKREKRLVYKICASAHQEQNLLTLKVYLHSKVHVIKVYKSDIFILHIKSRE